MKKILLVFLMQLPIILLGQVKENEVVENRTIIGREEVKATNSIVIKPTTTIEAGSDFTARIISNLYLPLSLSSNENYVFTRDYQIATTNTSVLESDDVIESVIYYDGLGRPKQSIAIKQSPTKKDIVTHIAYDDFGRQSEGFLPYESSANDGGINSDARLATQNFYRVKFPDDFSEVMGVERVNAFSKKVFDNSPLNRVNKLAAPGEDWKVGSGHEIEMEYDVNDGVRLTNIHINHEFNDGTDYKKWFPVGDVYLSRGMLVIFNNNTSGGCKLPLDLLGGKKLRVSYELQGVSDSPFDSRIYYNMIGSSELKSIGLTSDPVEGFNSHEVLLPEEGENFYFQIYIPAGTDKNFELDYFNVTEIENVVSENFIRKYSVNSEWDNQEKMYITELVDEGSYIEGGLFKTTTKNENWSPTQQFIYDNTVEEFENEYGQLVLKRSYSRNIKHDTYYIYDQFGNLIYVFPPKVDINDGISDDEFSELIYQYKYDKRNRLIEKKIPGKEREYFVYDKLDRPVLTQDANLRSNKEWLFTKYDAFGREVYTGVYTHKSVVSQPIMQGFFDNENDSDTASYEEKLTERGSESIYYSTNNFPNINVVIFTVNYYDNYVFDKVSTPSSVVSYGVNSTDRLKGLLTGTKIRVLGTDLWTTTVHYYDEKARPIYVYSHDEYLKTTDLVESKLDFTGKILETKAIHKKKDENNIVIVDSFEYDHVTRLKKQKQKINDQLEEVIVENNYDELGILTNKKVGGGLQDIAYSYNIHGWLLGINEDDNDDNDLFDYTIRYNRPTSTGVALFNGNISQTSWKTKSNNSTGNLILSEYNYRYDALNRIKSAVGTNNSNYDLSYVEYDKNGNILKLERRGHVNEEVTSFGLMDDLKYTYKNNGVSNRLLKVEELDGGSENFGFREGGNVGDDYSYDENGNVISDANKGVKAIVYNHLDLPVSITTDKGQIYYVYDALGRKLMKEVGYNGDDDRISVTEYAGNFIYKNGELQFFNQSEGYVKKNKDVFDYVYQYKDHLENIRLSYTDSNDDGVIDSNTEILDEKNYYPFGLKHKGYNSVISSLNNATANVFSYNGKELNEDFELDWYDLGARSMDPTIGRFMTIDPLADVFSYQSPYVMAENNPIYHVDVHGLGILNVIGNFFKRLAKKIKSFFTGACDISGCKSYATSWDEADFPNLKLGPIVEYIGKIFKKKKNRSKSNNSSEDESVVLPKVELNIIDFDTPDIGLPPSTLPELKKAKKRRKHENIKDIDFFNKLVWKSVRLSEEDAAKFGSGSSQSGLNVKKSRKVLGAILETLATDPKLKLYLQVAEGDEILYGQRSAFTFTKRIENLQKYLIGKGVRKSRIKVVKDRKSFSTYISKNQWKN